jgi:hypothetical protein
MAFASQPSVVMMIGDVGSAPGLVSSGSSTNTKQAKSLSVNLETVKIKELQNELEALRRERDEAKRLATEILEKAQKLPINVLEGN